MPDPAAPADDDFEYRPLVAKGEDREAKLAEVIERWATETREWMNKIENPGFYNTVHHLRKPGTLVGFDLRDDNDGADIIDLGCDLLEPLAYRLAATEQADEAKPLALAALVKCKVHKTHAVDLAFPFHLVIAHSKFSGYCALENVAFHGNVWFKHTEFIGEVTFDRSVFHSRAIFDNATFRREAFFETVSFKSTASFDCGKIAEYAIFDAEFHDEASFFWTDARSARIADSQPLLRTFPCRERSRRHWTDFLTWRRVRGLGELTAFTRVSYFALAGVPLLAGLWGPLRHGIAWLNGVLERTNAKLDEVLDKLDRATGIVSPEVVERLSEVAALLDGTLPAEMPLGWLLAFLAASLVASAHFVYQTHSPELIRQATEDDLVEQANERNRTDGEIIDERLHEAMGYLEEAARLMPHRHSQWFVRRRNRTVWIPNMLDHFQPARVPVVNERGEEESDPSGKLIMQVDPNPEVQPEDRKRIAIEEGQRARYAIAAFEAREAAWISGGLYGLAGWLLVMILLRQLAHVADASPAPWLAWPMYGLSNGYLVTGGFLLIASATVIGTLSVHDAAWWAWFTKPLRWLGVWKEEESAVGGGQ